jgi:hypothetical protein
VFFFFLFVLPRAAVVAMVGGLSFLIMALVKVTNLWRSNFLDRNFLLLLSSDCSFQFQRFHKGEHRRSHWQNVFAAVVGQKDNADRMTAAHIQELCRSSGGESDVTLPQAQRILLSIREQANSSATTTAGPPYQREDVDEDRMAAVMMNHKNRWIHLPERHQQTTLSEDDFLSLVLQQQPVQEQPPQHEE